MNLIRPQSLELHPGIGEPGLPTRLSLNTPLPLGAQEITGQATPAPSSSKEETRHVLKQEKPADLGAAVYQALSYLDTPQGRHV